MREWASGVAILTTVSNGEQHGMTVNSFASLSVEPPIIMVSMQTNSRTHDLVSASRIFGLTLLAADQRTLAESFASLRMDGAERFNDAKTETLTTGSPFLVGGLVYLDCRVQQALLTGSNTLFIADVLAVKENRHAAPLVYHDRGYRELKP